MTDEWVDYVVLKLSQQGKVDLADKIKDAKDLGLLTKVVIVVDRTTIGNANDLIGGITIVKVKQKI